MTAHFIGFFIAWIGAWYFADKSYLEGKTHLGRQWAAGAMIFLALAMLSIDFPFMQVVPQ